MPDASITFMGLNLVCEDMDKTIDFYRLLGFDIDTGPDRLWREGGKPHHLSEVDVGGAGSLEFDSSDLARVYNAGYADAPVSTIIGFGVPTREAVDEVHTKMTAAGHLSRQAPWDAFWGARYAVIADPDGRDVGIMSPRDGRRHPPPEL
jgi:catechol 2,3-dioxygenase-like lactoylglutathione lyase family enzyme